MNNTKESQYNVILHRVENLEKGFVAINEKLDNLISHQNRTGRVPTQSIVLMIVGFVSMISVILGGNLWLISSQVSPIATIVHKMDTKIQAIEVQRGVEKGELAKLKSETDENNLFRDRWYNLFRVPERDTRQDGRLNTLEVSIEELRGLIRMENHKNENK